MKQLWHGCITLISLLLLWQLIVTLFQLPPYILPTPWEVLQTWQSQFGMILTEARFTAMETLLGLLFGTLLGCSAALIMAYFRPFAAWMLPILIISQAIPTFAIAPLLVIWFGYGMLAKIITTIIMLFFPITSAFLDGLQRTQTGWIDLANSMHATPWRFFCFIRIPEALPSLATGLRVATVIAPIGAIVGEWVGASHGLGFLMLQANARMQIDVMFAGLFTLILFSLMLYFAMNALLKKIIWW